ncbi:unnamed protein product [Linum trigynum]|uniref:CCHC-type domain-containing protein n=1 Tax=Linum trigynum TaxID=586398 RepID=A0AAV2ED43_9ROSI
MVHVTEDQVIQFSLDEVQSTRLRASRTLLGRLFTADQISTLEMREALVDAWQIKGRVKVSMTTHELFEIMLPNVEAKSWALKRSPWIIKDRVLILRGWVPSIPRKIFEELSIAPFHIQLWGVQKDCCTKLFGRKFVGAAIGQVLESDIFACKDTGERFIKVRAVVDFAKPLRSQLMAASDDIDKFWVNLKYEFLPSFCYHCGRVGHARRKCTFDPPSGQERFGPHMSTKKLGRKIYDEDEIDNMRTGGHRQTVWVNRQIQGDTNNARTYVRGRDEVRPVTRKNGAAAVPKAKGGSVHDSKAHQPQGVQSSPTNKNASPRGFPMKKPPRIQLGRGNLQKLGHGGVPTEHMVHASEGTEVGALTNELSPDQSLLQGDYPGILANTRRRRMILVTDSDDDALELDRGGGAGSMGMKKATVSGLQTPIVGQESGLENPACPAGGDGREWGYRGYWGQAHRREGIGPAGALPSP